MITVHITVFQQLTINRTLWWLILSGSQRAPCWCYHALLSNTCLLLTSSPAALCRATSDHPSHAFSGGRMTRLEKRLIVARVLMDAPC